MQERNLIFIDANVMLDLYRQSERDIVKVEGILRRFSDANGFGFEVVLTDQVVSEFWRNRPAIIATTIQAIRGFKSVATPGHSRIFDVEYKQLKEAQKVMARCVDAIVKKIADSAESESLPLDEVMRGVFEKSTRLDTSINSEAYRRACYRHAVGNPPGKKESMGDQINWEALLCYPSDPDIRYNLHVVTKDRDFLSPLDPRKPGEFISFEWKKRNRGSLSVYSGLNDATNALEDLHDGVTPPPGGTLVPFRAEKSPENMGQVELPCGQEGVDGFDQFDSSSWVKNAQERQDGLELLDFEVINTAHELLCSRNFQATHYIVDRLSRYGALPREALELVLKAFKDNSQVYWISEDDDILDFTRSLVDRYKKKEPGLDWSVIDNSGDGLNDASDSSDDVSDTEDFTW